MHLGLNGVVSDVKRVLADLLTFLGAEIAAGSGHYPTSAGR